MINQTILNFKILKKLGEGGMGVVYKAEDTKLERPVAIKFLPREIAAQDDVKKRFKIEAKAAAALNHPNIATIYQIEEVDDKIFIVMEYIEGQELRQLVKTQGTIPVDDAITYAIQIADGLQAAHEKGVVHRDIKSANIMITDKGQVKIMDFGLAKLSGQTQLTKGGMTLGTIAYMSPEQAQGIAIDQRTDIWSFGVVLYEMLTGQLPFRGDYEQAILYSIMNEDPEPSPNLQDGGDQGLQQLVSKTLAKDPEHRYREMEEVLADLRAIIGATKTGPVTRAVERHTVGREKELAELHAALQNAFAGQSLLLCVAGEPGIGKTTVVGQFLDEVNIGGRPCLMAQGQCSERLAGTEAYLPFLEILASLLQKEVDVSVAKLMREKAPWWYVQVASLSPDDPANTGILADVQNATQERVKRELATFLQEVSSKRPLLLVFEDLHWADVSSIDMLAYLAPKFDAMRLLIVVTYRPAELLLTEHPFLQIKPDLLSLGQCRKISLGFLPQQEIEQYLTLEFPGHNFTEAFAMLIYDKTEGSPLFMVDLLRDLKNREVIVEQEDHWQLAQSVEDIKLELPDSVKGMIDHKVQQLGEDDHRLLVAASIQGFEFDSAVVGKVLEMDEEEVEERLQKLEQDHHFVHFTEEDEFPDRTLTLRYRFVHALYQNELYSSLTRTKRSRLSRTAAETLERFYGEKSAKVASELASLFETARDFEKAVTYLLKATETALHRFGIQEGLEHSGKVLAIRKRAQQVVTPEVLTQVCVLRVQLYYSGGRLTDGLRDMHEMLSIAREVEDRMLEGVALAWVGQFEYQVHNFDAAIQASEEAIKIARGIGNSAVEMQAKFNITITMAARGNMEKSNNLLQEVKKMNETIGDSHLKVFCLSLDATIPMFRGNHQQALVMWEKTVSAARESHNAMFIVFFQYLMAATLANSGQYARALDLLHEAETEGRELGDFITVAKYPNLRGWIHQELYDLPRAMEYNRQGVEATRQSGDHESEANSLVNFGVDYFLCGEYDEAEKYFQEALGCLEKDEWFAWRYKTRLLYAIGELYLAQNDYDQALDYANQSLELAESNWQQKNIAKAWHLRGKIFAATGKTDDAGFEFDRALEMIIRVGYLPHIWKTHFEQGKLLEGCGENEKAQEYYKQAVSTIEQMAANVGSYEELRTTFLSAAPIKAVYAALK